MDTTFINIIYFHASGPRMRSFFEFFLVFVPLHEKLYTYLFWTMALSYFRLKPSLDRSARSTTRENSLNPGVGGSVI